MKAAERNYPVSSTGQALHWLGFMLKRPKKRLLKADPVRREAFVAEYAALTAAAQGNGSKIFFADEAHFQATLTPYRGTGQALRGKWVLEGEPALVDFTSQTAASGYYTIGGNVEVTLTFS